MPRFYQGKYTCQFPEKYAGNYTNIQYRSSWERQAMRWCDLNPGVKEWVSEETVVPYRCQTDDAMHRYFVDLTIQYTSGKVVLVEIKPLAQTKRPKPSKRKYALNESLTYMKNVSKWRAAEVYAHQRGWEFQIWTEETLKNMGVKLL